ncbi:Nascent polypeptide associated complex NAC [Archaeoglobus sulfaticallidus PM70-1]|uniref:Nascent polypeptide-associated complex protein n=1 Tax=Archaeoglobus sulfaticallidus PM70-1 TaxID=387631 RepID=N0BCK4_9EURY|nr:nascent polypeptide-associated complex protein [Archaeoglobus sulfaticallidus]AGK60738.1 Nascent polypeptide associated complex NAC [Archaeoglobus sulfaticallidus PM70-1]
MLPTNPKQMKKMMKQMGIDMEEIEAEEVIIKTRGEEMIFKNPSVIKISAKGIETFQISGNYERIERRAEISEDDIKLIMEQANVSEEDARKALEECNGDLAEALMRLQG